MLVAQIKQADTAVEPNPNWFQAKMVWKVLFSFKGIQMCVIIMIGHTICQTV